MARPVVPPHVKNNALLATAAPTWYISSTTCAYGQREKPGFALLDCVLQFLCVLLSLLLAVGQRASNSKLLLLVACC